MGSLSFIDTGYFPAHTGELLDVGGSSPFTVRVILAVLRYSTSGKTTRLYVERD